MAFANEIAGTNINKQKSLVLQGKKISNSSGTSYGQGY